MIHTDTLAIDASTAVPGRDPEDPDFSVAADPYNKLMSSPATSGHAAAVPGRSPLPLGWFRGYDRAMLGADVLAGLTAAAVVLPKAMAYASVAGELRSSLGLRMSDEL